MQDTLWVKDRMVRSESSQKTGEVVQLKKYSENSNTGLWEKI